MPTIENRPKRLRPTDQETARVVALRRKKDGKIMGAGCLVSNTHILTCRHVIEKCAAPAKLSSKISLSAWLIGVEGQPSVTVFLEKAAEGKKPSDDLALLRIKEADSLDIPDVEFAAPLRHSGKQFSALGFPASVEQGRNATGLLEAADALGLVQMENQSKLLVQGGFSGAPVWCPDVSAFIGIVVSEAVKHEIAWCIPSSILSRFFPALPVRFRIPPSDRPPIFDYSDDDPNVQIFGQALSDAGRALKVTVKKSGESFKVSLAVEPSDGAKPLRGKYVTFITHPSFSNREEDAYELFSEIGADGIARNHFWCDESFTVAAIADACDTVLTVDLAQVKGKPKGFR
jgi:S1-C subfamily serine protease